MQGFTLTELLVGVAIVGILGAIALPNYFSQVSRSRQSEAASTISQIQTNIAAFADEFGVLPASWADLHQTSAIMTIDGPATNANFDPIALAGGHYNVTVVRNENIFTITATPTRDDNDVQDFNVIACVNLSNGASDIDKGTKDAAASDLNCG